MMASAGKRVGILTSGGDCAGLNAAIRAVTQRAVSDQGWEVFGILEGTSGLLPDPPRFVRLDPDTLRGDLIRQSGTILGTVSHGSPFTDDEPGGNRTPDFVRGCRSLQLDAIIGIGGDGSMRILPLLARAAGLPFIGIPKTIDNDVPGTDYAIGYSSAVESAVQALDCLQPTAASHRRVMVLEVMGRDAGWIAVAAGIAGGADIILIPEIPASMERVAHKLETLFARGHTYSLVVCAEGVKTTDGERISQQFVDGSIRYGGVGNYLGAEISRTTEAETRVTVLGHVQRGANPCPFDRILATTFGTHAVDLLARGCTDRLVAWRDHRVTDIELAEIEDVTRILGSDDVLMQVARKMDICLGD